MGRTVGDGMVVMALAGAFVAYLYFKHVERRRRLEIIHQERLVAMEKGIPLPELPLDPTKAPPNPRAPLIQGIVWTALGGGAMLMLALIGRPGDPAMWPVGIPLVLLGIGLMLYYALAKERAR